MEFIQSGDKEKQKIAKQPDSRRFLYFKANFCHVKSFKIGKLVENDKTKMRRIPNSIYPYIILIRVLERLPVPLITSIKMKTALEC